MLRVCGIVCNMAEISICHLWDSSSHEMVKVERYSTIWYSLVPKWIKSVRKGLGKKLKKIHTHGSQDAECLAQVGSTPRVFCWRANHWPKIHRQERHAEIGRMSLTWPRICSRQKKKQLTEIVVWAVFLWSNAALIMQFTEGSKNAATSVLIELC
jgi:hypothetical protein